MNDSLSIYVHIPFCQTKCNYCDFYSLSKSNLNKQIISRYLNSVLNELRYYEPFLKEYKIESIYFGGGTPNSIDDNLLQKFLNNFLTIIYENQKNSFSKIKEITIELNPQFVTSNQIKILKDNNINRISLGIQALSNRDLEFLGRNTNLIETLKAIDLILSNFENVSLDFIIGLPYLKIEKEIKIITNLLNKYDSLKHFSFYMLNIAFGTPLFSTIFRTNKNLYDKIENKSAEDYLKLCRIFKDLDFEHYEISNFSKKDFYSIHNLRYWKGEPYIGVGSFAYSFIFDLRFHNNCISNYLKTWENYIHSVHNINSKLNRNEELRSYLFSSMITKDRIFEKIDERMKINEHIMLYLRLKEGFSLTEFYKKFGFNFYEKKKKELTYLSEKNQIKIVKDILSINEEAWLFYNPIVSQLFL